MIDKDKKSHSRQDKGSQDNNLWEEVTKDIEPLDARNDANLSKTNKKRDTDKPLAINNRVFAEASIKREITAPAQSNEVDSRTYSRFKRGQMQIDARLDLHGMTQNQAYDALLSFIPNAYFNGKRCVLIITGKGSNKGTSVSLADQGIGILKQKTPEWLSYSPLDRYILKTHVARQNHGGEGALYVLLRRIRN